MRLIALALGSAVWAAAAAVASAGPAQDAASYADAIEKLNQAHARQPGRVTEADLAKRLPSSAKSALDRVLAAKPSAELAPALLRCGEAALDLDRSDDFERVRAKLAGIDSAVAGKLGTAISRPRLIVRGIGEFHADYLSQFADVCDAVLAGYDEVFGFAEFSKIPGKKLRFRVHLEPAITQPPHFAPQFPWHSEIDFPVADGTRFSSPTPQGHFLLYGLCHELGHVVAMWGDLNTMEDKHTWAHYTGVAIVEHLAKSAQGKPWKAQLEDARWRSLQLERELPGNRVAPSTGSYAGVMAMWLALDQLTGPKTLGAALNALDARHQCRRINHVRYAGFAEFEKALTALDREHKDEIAKIFGGRK